MQLVFYPPKSKMEKEVEPKYLDCSQMARFIVRIKDFVFHLNAS